MKKKLCPICGEPQHPDVSNVMDEHDPTNNTLNKCLYAHSDYFYKLADCKERFIKITFSGAEYYIELIKRKLGKITIENE